MGAPSRAAIAELRSGWAALRVISREDASVNANRGAQAALAVYRLGRALIDSEASGLRPAKPLGMLYRLVFWLASVVATPSSTTSL